jgi:hypothetical protein
MSTTNEKISIVIPILGNIGFLSLLTLLFIGLRLSKIIMWSWLWVLSPLWIPPAIILAILLLIVLSVAILYLLGK